MAIYIIPVLAILVLWIFFYFVPVGLWISALAASVPIGPMTLIGMKPMILFIMLKPALMQKAGLPK